MGGTVTLLRSKGANVEPASWSRVRVALARRALCAWTVGDDLRCDVPQFDVGALGERAEHGERLVGGAPVNDHDDALRLSDHVAGRQRGPELCDLTVAMVVARARLASTGRPGSLGAGLTALVTTRDGDHPARVPRRRRPPQQLAFESGSAGGTGVSTWHVVLLPVVGRDRTTITDEDQPALGT